MNTIEELTSLGIPEATAERMLESYKAHIGEMHGCNKVTDITYNGKSKRDIELTCTLCGAKYHKILRNSGDKWSELRRTCVCQRQPKEAIPKPGVVRNDDPSYIGKVYGDYRVVGFFSVPHERKSGSTVMWKCECVGCGSERSGLPSRIRRYNTCAVCEERRREEEWKLRIGERYGRLTIVGFERRQSGKNNMQYAICNCDCGRSVKVQYAALKYLGTKSCGCIQDEFIKKARDGRKEARSRSPLYSTWSGMRARCFNPTNANYANYGGRGITVCDEWLGPEGFDRFEKWSYENGYSPETGVSLDRIDVNGNYEPSNCRYASVYVQAVNQRKPMRRAVRQYSIDGETKTLRQWCREYSISEVAVKYRMDVLGMDIETALKTPKTRKGNIFAGKQARERSAAANKDLNKCDSYIEANLYLAFAKEYPAYKLIPQYPIDEYRVDFWVEGTNVVVECDGYDFHKTKEQISADYKRERYLLTQGYVVVRLSGTEINADPEGCCREIMDVVVATNEQDRQAHTG